MATFDDDGPEKVALNCMFRDSDAGGEKVLRTVGLGIRPIVLIEPNFDDTTDEVVVFDIDATDVNREGLADLLELLLLALRGEDA